MRGVSPVIATVLLVAVAIVAAVGFYAWTEATMSSTQSTASAQANKVFTLPLTIEAAQMSTPYTWDVIVRNPNGVDVDANQLILYVKDAKGDICAVSSGVVGGSIPAHGVKKLTFYGFDKCEIPANMEQWKLTLSAGGYKTAYTVPVSSSSMGLVLWMPMEDVWKFDKSGNGLDVHYYDEEFQGTLNGVHNGVLEGNPKWVNGKFGTALEFNANQDVNLGNVLNDVFVSGTFSICLWDYLNSYKNEYKNAAGMIIDKWHTSGEQDNAFILYTTGFNGNTGYLHYTQPLKQWNHICVISKSGDVNIYVNGMLNASGSGFEYNSTTYPLLIGNLWNLYYDLNGKVDDVRIYDRALTDKEVKELYEGKDVRDGLVLYLPFDEGTGTTAWDWHSWSKQGLWLDGQYDGTTDNYVTNIYGLPSTITTPYTMVAEANVSKPNDALITRTTAYATIWLGSENYRPCIHVDYNYNDGVDPLDLCINDINMFNKDCRLAAEYIPPNGPAKICGSCGGAVECNSVSTYNYGNPDPAQNTAATTIGAIWERDLVDNTRGIIRDIRYYSRALSENELRCVVSNPNCLIDDKNLVVMYTFQEPCRSGPTDLSTNKVCRAPRIVEVNGYDAVKLWEDRQNYFWLEPGTIRGKFSVFAAASIDQNESTSSSTIVSSRTPVDFGFDFKFRDDGHAIHGDVGDGAEWMATSADVPYDYEFNKIYTITYNVTPKGGQAFVDNTENNGTYTQQGTPLLTDENHILLIGRMNFTSEKLGGRIASIIVLKKRSIGEQTVTALCKLFKAC